MTSSTYATGAFASTLDIDYLNATTIADRDVSNTWSFAHSFSPTISGQLTSVAVVVGDTRRSGTLTLAIEGADSLKVPNGTRLASHAVSHDDVPDTFGILTVEFASPAFVDAGNRYTLVLETDSGDFQWYLAQDNYPDEVESANAGGHWASGPSNLAFGIYIGTGQETEQPATAPRAHIQQFGLHTGQTCAESAPTDLNWSGVSAGGWGQSWAQWMNDGLGGAVCTRTLVYSNSQGRWVLAQ